MSLNLVNFIDRLKLEHKIVNKLKLEIPFITLFILTCSFLCLEIPSKQVFDFNSNLQNTLNFDGPSINELSVISDKLLNLTIKSGAISSVTIVNPLLVIKEFPVTYECQGNYSHNDSSSVLCFAGEDHGSFLAGSRYFKDGFCDGEYDIADKTIYAVAALCQPIWKLLKNTNRINQITVKYAMYLPHSKCIALQYDKERCQ